MRSMSSGSRKNACFYGAVPSADGRGGTPHPGRQKVSNRSDFELKTSVERSGRGSRKNSCFHGAVPGADAAPLALNAFNVLGIT